VLKLPLLLIRGFFPLPVFHTISVTEERGTLLAQFGEIFKKFLLKRKRLCVVVSPQGATEVQHDYSLSSKEVGRENM